MPPLREADLHGIVINPAKLLSARFESDNLARNIAKRAAADSAKDAGALPLLSYLLDDMWTKMIERADGVLRLPGEAVDLGRVLLERANRFIDCDPETNLERDAPGKAQVADALRRIFTLKLATVREDSEPTRRRAHRSEFSDEEWAIVSQLADEPNRLLVTVTTEDGETYAEVAHEAIFGHWEALKTWIAAEREFLAWRSGLELARRTWQAAPEGSKYGALLMGLALDQAQSWFARRSADIPAAERQFVSLS